MASGSTACSAAATSVSVRSEDGTALPVRFDESRLARALLRLAGWRVVYQGFPTRQGVAIVYPHTSNWDFVVMVLAKWTIGVPARWWGKDSLFRLPVLGRWMRWLGGIPLDRRSSRGVVAEMVAVFDAAKAADELLWLGLSPEMLALGTLAPPGANAAPAVTSRGG